MAVARPGTSIDVRVSLTALERLPLSLNSSCITRDNAAARLASSESNCARPQRACSHSTPTLNMVSATTMTAPYQRVRRARMERFTRRPGAEPISWYPAPVASE